MLFKFFSTSSPAKSAAATTTQSGSQPQRASPPPAPISKLRGIFRRFRRFVAHPKGAPAHPQESIDIPAFATSSAIPYPIAPLTTAAFDLATARKKIAELESTLCHLERQKTDQIKNIHNMFYNNLVPTATAYVNELEGEAAARRIAEEQLEQEMAGRTKADELRLKEREKRWEAEEAKDKARHEMETVREETRKLEGQLLDLQAQTDHLHVKALQEALKRVEHVDASNHPTLGKSITPFIERLYADAGSDSGRSWSSSWFEFPRITAGSEPQRAGLAWQEPSDMSEEEETCSDSESEERSRASPDPSQWSNEGLTCANRGSGSPVPRSLANPLRRMPRGRQGGRLNAMRVASAFGDSSDEDDFGEVLEHRTYRVPYPDNGDESD
ncbi:hypothetical protein FRC05_003477 [Tulasnella sp. 425]|nr:hypothetical protein FRC05_003477 [Tulasnella sp. 425]